MSDEITITSLVGYKTGQPLVELRWGDKRAQLTATEARAHAMKILECAEAAETDLFFVTFMTEEIGTTLEQAVQVLQKFRQART